MENLRGVKPVFRACARGVVAAMAMTGLRQVTTSMNWVRRTPPESVLRRTAPQLFCRVTVPRRTALVEAIHWSYGAAGGALFGTLPYQLRHRPWVGPTYGFLFWGIYQVGITPLLGLNENQNRWQQQLALVADHLLYGAVVASSWPYRH